MTNYEYRYSLCLTYPGAKGQLLLYRMVDFLPEQDKLVRAYYTDKAEAEYVGMYDPVIIGSNPEKLELNKAEIRKWIPTEYDSTKQNSYEEINYGKPFEIVFPNEFKEVNYSNEEIRQILHSGIVINEEVSEAFLMVVKYEENNIIALYCKKDDFIVNGVSYRVTEKVTDMMHEKHYFEKYVIKHDEIVTTNDLNEQLYNGFKFDRCFYYRLHLPEKFEKFCIRDAKSYVPNYMSSYLKLQKEKYQFTKNEIKRFLRTIQEMVSYETEIEKFFEGTGLNKQEIIDTILQSVEEIEKFFINRTDLEEIIEKILFKNEDVYNKCIEIAKKEWMCSQDKERELVISEIIKIKEQREAEIVKLSEVDDKISKCNLESIQTQDKLVTRRSELEELLAKQATIEKEIRNSILNFKNEIVNSTKTLGICEATLSQCSVSGDETEIFSKILSYPETKCENIGIIENLEDLADALEENLAINFDESYEMASLILASLLCKKVVIVNDYSGEIVAKAFAYLVDGKGPTYISLSEPQNNVSKVINHIQKSETKTIFIDGVINCYDENTFVAICKNCENKHIFFGTGSMESIRSCSKNIWNYAVFLNADEQIKISSNEIPRIGECEIDKFIVENHDIVKKHFNKILPLCKGGVLKRSLAINFSKVLRYYRELIIKDTSFIVACALITMCNDTEGTDALLEAYGISEELLNKAKGVE